MSDEHSNTMHGQSLVVVGAGGNIGSHLVPHLGRMLGVKRVTLIDRDTYESRNLRSQDATPNTVGKPKAFVQARRLRRIDPELQVVAIADAVEDVPLGRLRADVLLACLDSREARRRVNQMAWRLGMSWIDAGVEADGMLVRIEVFVPSADGPCHECKWEDHDYELAEQEYACNAANGTPAPTNAPSSLGGLAASLQAIECRKLLAGQVEQAAVGRQVLIDASHHKHYVTKLSRNPKCRFDHEVWSISNSRRRPSDLTIGDALTLGGDAAPSEGQPELSVEGKAFVRSTACPRCGHRNEVFRLQRRLRSTDLKCPECGPGMVAVGFEMLDVLEASLPRRLLARKLSRVGFGAGDVLSVGSADDGMRHYEIGDDA